MRASELRFEDLFELCPQKGILLFRKQRMLLFDADAIGRLRKELIWTLGEDRARGVLTRFGFASGFSHAVQMREMFDWDSDEDWLRAGFCLYSLMGMIQSSAQNFEVDRALGKFHFEVELAKSFEVDTHLQHLGRSKTATCWILAGFASGYCSAYFGDEVFFLEDQCAARGDSCCHFVGKTREEWGQQLNPHLKFFEEEDIARELQELYRELSRKNKELEETLEALRASEERYRDLFENTSDLIQSITPEGRFLYVNRAWRERLGYSPEEFSKLTMFDIIHPDSLEHCSKVFQQILSGEQVRNMEAVFVARDGRKITVEGTTNCSFVDGKPVSTQGIFRDISDRKRAEEALREKEEFLRGVFTSIQDGINVIDRDLNILRTNSWLEEMYASETPLVGKKCYRVFQRRADPCPNCPSLKSLNDGEVHTESVPYPSQEDPEGWLELTAYPLKDSEGAVRGVIEYSKDITERKKMEEALRESEERYRMVSELTSDYIVTMSVSPSGQMKMESASERFQQLTGYTREELSSLNVLAKIVHHDDLWRFQNFWQTIISSGKAGELEFRGITRRGELKWLHIYGQPVVDRESKSVIRIVTAAKDISDRKRAEEALRESEHMYRTLVDNLPQRIFYKNKDCVYVSCNENFARDLNIRTDEFAGKTDYDFFPRELAEKYRADDKRLMESGETEDIEEKYIQEGKELFVHTVKTPVRDEEGNVVGILGVFWDITERKRTEEVLRQAEEERNRVLEALRGAEKLAVVGEMAGRVAHEVLNPVTALLSRTQAERDYLEATSKALRAMGEIVDDWQTNLKQGRLSEYLLQRDKDEGRATFAEQDLAVLSQASRKNRESLDRSRELLSFFEQQLGRVVRIVDNLRQMSRTKREVREVEVNHCLQQVAELFQEGLNKRHIRLNYELTAQVPKVFANYTELFQVFSNLLRNAMLTVEAKRRQGGQLTVSSRAVGEEVWVRVVDDGVGIPESKQASVFEHDFSAGSGTEETGLDMAISRRLVRGMGGELLLESSSVEEGSVFLVKLPLTKGQESAERYTERVARG